MKRLLLLCFLVTLGFGQDIPIRVEDMATPFDPAALHNWEQQPGSLVLAPQSANARTGKAWIRKSAQGLIVAGSLSGGPPQFPAHERELMAKEHIEIWLAVTQRPTLPPVGWGNQFEDIDLPNGEESCKNLGDNSGNRPTEVDVNDCRVWVRKQKAYRAYFNRLFTRQWQLAPGLVAETFASPAYDTIAQRFLPDKEREFYDLPELLKPTGGLHAVFKSHSNGYEFEVLIPWKAFPPSASETLQDISVLVEAFRPAEGKKSGPYATSSPKRRYGDATTFNHLHFDKPRKYELTPCGYDMVGLDIHDSPTPALFFPAESDMISDVFILENYKRGYAYGPSGLSPGTRTTHFFWKQIAKDEYVCGPILRHKKGERAKDLEVTEHQHTWQALIEGEQGFAVRKLADGYLLIKDGPRETWSKYGSGQCGACPRAEMAMYSLSPALTLERIFEQYDVIDSIEDMDIQLSSDWSRIAVYRLKQVWTGSELKEPEWDDQFYCLKGLTYKECAPREHKPAPEPRSLHFDPESLE